jgi:hypothetical protein
MVAANSIADLPYYHRVPKGPADNLRMRQKLWKAGAEDPQVAREILTACSRDVLFYINLFAFTYDVMRSDPPDVPFITFPFQDEAILTVIHWFWMFRRMQSFLLVSRNKDYVDKAGNPKSLFWKLDFLNNHLPVWMKPDLVRTDLHMENKRTASVVDGESTTGDVAAGDRRTAIFLDEFSRFEVADGFRSLAASQHATRCRIFNSTPNGVGNAHHKMYQSNVKKLRLHWSDWPEKAAGLYTSEGGKLKILDRDYWRAKVKAARSDLSDHAVDYLLDEPPDEFGAIVGYAFIRDDKLRSPYYDDECERTPIQSLIKQELDIDYLGSGGQFFEAAELEKARKDFARAPFQTGELHFDGATCHPEGFKRISSGRLKLWFHPDAAGDPPRDRKYVIGTDVSAGTGASNSCMSVLDAKTGEKVAAFVCPHTRPERLADYACALGRWFAGSDGRPAFIVFEGQGPGSDFGQRLAELHYTNLYYHASAPSGKISKKPGWFSTGDGKRNLLTNYGCAMIAGQFINRDAEAIQECYEYVWLKSGEIGHSRAEGSLDPSGAKHNHGDRVIGDALAWLGMKETPKRAEDVTPVAPPGSFAWRREQYDKQQKELAKAGWQVV